MPFRVVRGEFLDLLGRARQRPAGFLLRRGMDEVRARLRTCSAALGRNPYRARLREGADGGALVLDPEEVARTVARSREEWPDRVDTMLAALAASADRPAEVLSVPVPRESGMDWHRDHAADEVWPVRFHATYAYSELTDPSRSTDIKVPWELSRLQILPRLAFAYRLTGDETHLTVARCVLEDWDRANPVGYGINWTVGMEVALRSISVILTLELIAGTAAEARFSDARVTEMLSEHGRFLYRNVEYSDVNGNHYTSCLLGLLYLGVRLAREPESPKWRAHALERLEQEIRLQTYSDGVCHEGSIPYHLLVTELFAHALLVARRSGEGFGSAYRERLGAMLEFLRHCMKPRGEVPIWGDCDDGRVFSLGGGMAEHLRAVCALGTSLVGRSDGPCGVGPFPLEAALLLGDSRADAGADGADAAGGSVDSRGFEEGGFFVIRTANDFCLVDCGDVGLRGRGGHGHNDALSVELTLGGHDVLVDTGCASYTRSLRERTDCIGAAAHNAVVLEGREPAPLDLTRIPHPTACRVEVERWDPEAGLFVGRRYGYEELPGTAAYTRRVERSGPDGSFVIGDQLDGHGTYAAAWHFHLARGWSLDELEDARALFRRGEEAGRGVRLEITWRVRAASAEVVRTPVYPSYGRRLERPCLVVRASLDLPESAEFRFRVDDATRGPR